MYIELCSTYRYHKWLYALTWVLTLHWRFVFGALKRDWLLILALQTTFNVHYFFFEVLVLALSSLPYTAAMMLIMVKNKRISFDLFPEFSMTKVL
jgi:hypothetical protein